MADFQKDYHVVTLCGLLTKMLTRMYAVTAPRNIQVSVPAPTHGNNVGAIVANVPRAFAGTEVVVTGMRLFTETDHVDGVRAAVVAGTPNGIDTLSRRLRASVTIKMYTPDDETYHTADAVTGTVVDMWAIPIAEYYNAAGVPVAMEPGLFTGEEFRIVFVNQPLRQPAEYIDTPRSACASGA